MEKAYEMTMSIVEALGLVPDDGFLVQTFELSSAQQQIITLKETNFNRNVIVYNCGEGGVALEYYAASSYLPGTKNSATPNNSIVFVGDYLKITLAPGFKKAFGFIYVPTK